MENRGISVGDMKMLAGNTRLHSDVTIQYFSWAEYDFMRPPQPKTASAMLAAFISNCGPQYRLNYLDQLMKSGVSVHSYGQCMNNMPEQNKGNNHINEMSMTAPYKFTMAFENSETDDYVTEKMFQPLVAGSVPIYHGAPNAKKFAPTDHSVIFASDFGSPQALAKYLQYLDKNDTAYNEYLAWKTEGPSKDWIALVDMSIVHSECRFCIRSADIDRLTVGEVITGPLEEENRAEMKKYAEIPNALTLKVRERGEFWMRRIHLEDRTVKELLDKIKRKWNDPDKGQVHSVYELWDRNKVPIRTDDRVKELIPGHELEVISCVIMHDSLLLYIFENPGLDKRDGYYSWWKEHQQQEKV